MRLHYFHTVQLLYHWQAQIQTGFHRFTENGQIFGILKSLKRKMNVLQLVYN